MMENHIKMDDLGVPLFLETPKWDGCKVPLQLKLYRVQDPKKKSHEDPGPGSCKSCAFWAKETQMYLAAKPHIFHIDSIYSSITSYCNDDMI